MSFDRSRIDIFVQVEYSWEEDAVYVCGGGSVGRHLCIMSYSKETCTGSYCRRQLMDLSCALKESFGIIGTKRLFSSARIPDSMLCKSWKLIWKRWNRELCPTCHIYQILHHLIFPCLTPWSRAFRNSTYTTTKISKMNAPLMPDWEPWLCWYLFSAQFLMLLLSYPEPFGQDPPLDFWGKMEISI